MHYVVVGTTFETNGLPAVTFGLCLPKNCDDDEYFSDLLDRFKKYILDNQHQKVNAYVSFPNVVNKEPISGFSWIVISIIFVILILFIIGTITKFTKLFDDTNFTEEQRNKMDIEDRKTPIGLFFYCFSPVYTISRIFNTDKIKEDDLNVLSGLKVVSICFIMVGTSFLYIIYVPISNIQSLNELFKNPLFGLIPGSFFGIDVFYFITGILVFSALTKKMYHDIESFSISWLYLRKFYRIFLSLLFIMGITIGILPYLGDGPFYRKSWDPFIENWGKYWWTNLLFINNLMPWNPEQLWMPWLFYLANDMQYFLLSPPIIYLYWKNRKASFWVLGGLICSAMLYMLIITFAFDLQIQMLDDDPNMLSLLLTKPWCAWNSYFIGGVVGLSYFELKHKNNHPEFKDSFFNKIYTLMEKSNKFLFACFATGAFLLWIYVFPLGKYYDAYYTLDEDFNAIEDGWPTWLAALYNTTSRTLFIFGLSLLICPMFVNKFQFGKQLLSSHTLHVISRLSLSVYLIHIPLLWWVEFDTRQSGYVTTVTQLFLAFGNIIFSHIAAVVFMWFAESPLIAIEKHFISGKISN